jgi:hypothetical protein
MEYISDGIDEDRKESEWDIWKEERVVIMEERIQRELREGEKREKD